MALALIDGNVGDTVVDTVTEHIDLAAMLTIMKSGVSGVFSLASSAFDFLIDNPLCAIMVCIGFAYTALSIVHKAIRTAKRS